MSDTNAPEPTMEEILASIRRIISEDDAAAPAAAISANEAAAQAALAAARAPLPEPPPAPEPEPEPAPPAAEDDVLELTDYVEPPAEPEPEVAPAPAAAPPLRPAPAPSAFDSLGDLDVSAPVGPGSSGEDDPLVTSAAAERAAGHFGQLAQSLAMPPLGRTLEDVVRELLRPLLKQWLEQHLPAIVEARVQAEVERISRGRGF